MITFWANKNMCGRVGVDVKGFAWHFWVRPAASFWGSRPGISDGEIYREWGFGRLLLVVRVLGKA